MFSSAGDSAGAVADREVGPDVDSPNPMVDEEENNAHFFFLIYLYCASYHKLQGKCAPLLITHLQGAAYMKAREYLVLIEM